jgi:hypothetical protein
MVAKGPIIGVEFCGYLYPRERRITVPIEETRHHTCRLKEVMGSPDTRCAFSVRRRSDSDEHDYMVYYKLSSEHCPTFIQDQNEMGRLADLLMDFRTK